MTYKDASARCQQWDDQTGKLLVIADEEMQRAITAEIEYADIPDISLSWKVEGAYAIGYFIGAQNINPTNTWTWKDSTSVPMKTVR